MANGPRVLYEKRMVVVGREGWEDRREVQYIGIPVLARAVSIAHTARSCQQSAVGCPRARDRAPGMLAGAYAHQRNVAVLANGIGETIELVARLDVVGTAPPALEERYIFVELVVLAGVINGVRAVIGLRTSAPRLLKAIR